MLLLHVNLCSIYLPQRIGLKICQGINIEWRSGERRGVVRKGVWVQPHLPPQKCGALLKTSQHNHSMSNFGVFLFFSSKLAEFLCMVSNCSENPSPVFFLWFALHFRVKTYAKNRRLWDASLISLFGKIKGFFYFSLNNRLQKAPPSFLHTF